MKSLTKILENRDEYTLELEELEEYMDSVSKQLPKEVMDICYIMKKANILSRDAFEEIIVSGTSKLNAEAKKRGVSVQELQSMQKVYNKMKLERLLIPIFQTSDTRNDFINGDKTAEDIMLDMVSDRGRADIVKQYTPLMNKIASQYLGKSSLTKAELLSAAMMGLVQAMNDYKKNVKDLTDASEDTLKMHRLSFKTYAAYRIKQRILNDINWNSRTVRIPSRTASRHKNDENPLSKSVYIDQMENSDAIDKLIGVAINPRTLELPSSANISNNAINAIYKLIEERFSQQKAIIFYCTFGLNGYDAMRQVDISKKFNISSANISMSNKRIAKFLRETPSAQPLLKALLQHVQESIFIENMKSNKEELTEAFMSNDMFLLLEDLTRLSDPIILESILREVLSEYDMDSVNILLEVLEKGSDMCKENYKTNKKLFVHFLESVNPTMSIAKKSDVTILDELDILSNAYNTSKIKL